MTQGIVGDTLEDDAEYAHEDDGEHAGQGEREIQVGHQPHGYEGRDHCELSLREIDDVYRVEDQDEPQGHKGVYGTHGQTCGYHLKICRPIH